jgi:KDO2-lipid IV(A) lauroyltransferase
MHIFLLQSVLRLFAALPLACALGAVLGRLLFIVPNRRQRTARVNLELCFPEMSAAAHRRLLRRNLIELGKSLAELGALWTLDRENLSRLVRSTSGEEKLKQEMQRGKGLILAAPHLGAWEMVGIYCSMHYPITGLYRVLQDTRKRDIVREARERFGARMVPADNVGIRALYQALARGEMIWIMPDQVPARRRTSVFAPFFGIPASTMVLLSRLAIKTGAPVVFGYAERLPRCLTYHMHFLPAPAEINRGSVESSAAVLNHMVEKCVCAVPEQYQWTYKRFRVRPPGEKAFY